MNNVVNDPRLKRLTDNALEALPADVRERATARIRHVTDHITMEIQGFSQGWQSPDFNSRGTLALLQPAKDANRYTRDVFSIELNRGVLDSLSDEAAQAAIAKEFLNLSA